MKPRPDKPRPAGKPAELVIETIIDAASWEDLDGLPELTERAARAALAACSATACGELAILFTDDDRMRALNQRFRGKDSPTNVLSFPPQEDGRLGDIALAFETIRSEACADGKSFIDHLTHLIVHGTLHLAGYDHEEEKAAVAMESLEVKALAGLGIGDPYRDNVDQPGAVTAS